METLEKIVRYKFGIEHIAKLRELRILDTIKNGNAKRRFESAFIVVSRLGGLIVTYTMMYKQAQPFYEMFQSLVDGDYIRASAKAAEIGVAEAINYAAYRGLRMVAESSESNLPPIESSTT